MASKELIIADPVYEGRTTRHLINFQVPGRFEPEVKVL